MRKLPVLSAREVLKTLANFGFILIRQRGSHMIIGKQTASGKKGAVIPKYDEIATGTLKSILKQAKVSEDDFLRVLKKRP